MDIKKYKTPSLEDDTCDLDPTKICDNCCKCLFGNEESRSVKISKILTTEEEVKDFDDLDEDFEYQASSSTDADEHTIDDDYTIDPCCDEKYIENKDEWELIDDIDGLSEALKNEELFEKVAEESCPGLIKLKLKRNNK